MRSLKSRIDLCRRLQFALIVGAAVVVVLFFLAIYRPRQAYLTRVNDLRQQTRADLSFARTQSQRLPGAQADFDRLQAVLANDEYLPSASDEGDLFRRLTNVAAKAGVDGLEIEFSGPTKPTGNLSQVPLQLKFQAPFPTAASFLDRLQHCQRLTRMNELSIHDAGDGAVEVSLSESASIGPGALNASTRPVNFAGAEPARNIFNMDTQQFPKVEAGPPVAVAPETANKPQVIVVVIPQSSDGSRPVAIGDKVSAEQVLEAARSAVRGLLGAPASQPSADTDPREAP